MPKGYRKMPYKKGGRRRTYKKYPRRYPRYSKALIAPNRCITKLPYNWRSSQITDGVFGNSIQQFRINSIFDPDYTGVGSQPMGRDEYAAFYERYTVYAAKIDIDVISLNEATLFATVVSTDSTFPATLEEIDENKYGRTLSCRVGIPNRISYYIDMKKFFGLRSLEDDKYRTLCTANPGDLCYLSFTTAHLDGTSSVSCYVTVRITYYVKFDTMLLLTQS